MKKPSEYAKHLAEVGDATTGPAARIAQRRIDAAKALEDAKRVYAAELAELEKEEARLAEMIARTWTPAEIKAAKAAE